MARLKQTITQPLVLLLVAFSLILTSISALAADAQLPVIIPKSPNIDAKAWVLMDADTGKVIASKDMNKRLPPASLTKLMTIYVVSQALRQGQISLDDKVRISKKAWKTGGSRMFVKVGSTVPLQDLIEGVIVASGNDACVALAEHVAGSEDSFASLMNKSAARLGMKHSHYVDSTGLPSPDHYATPYDLALLTQAIINDFPEDYQWYKQKWITWNNIKQPNRNRLLWRDPSVDGLKTGHTQEAGYCLISSGKRDGMRLISIVMGAPSDSARADDSQALLNWGFRFYETRKIFDANQTITDAAVSLGQQKQVALGVTKPLYLTLPRGQYKNIKADMQLPDQLEAPIVKGQQYGKVEISLEGNVMATMPLIALADNPEGGFFSRMSDHFKSWMSRL